MKNRKPLIIGHKPVDGFSLLELVIYIALLSGVAVFAAGSFISVSKGSANAEARYTVDSNIRYALDRIRQDVKDADGVNSPLLTFASNSLVLTANVNTTTYALAGGQITRQVNSGAAQNITSSKVNVSNMAFRLFENNSLPLNYLAPTINVSITAAYNSGSADYSFSETLNKTILMEAFLAWPARGAFGSPSGCGGCGGSCFLAGTKVLMGDGSLKAIEEVKEGDIVASYDLIAGKKVHDVVDKLLIHKDIIADYLVVNNVLKVTTNHLIWSTRGLLGEGGFNLAGNLEVGDRLLDSDGRLEKIYAIKKITAEKRTVYNLQLPGANHNYFADGVLVHNMKLPKINQTPVINVLAFPMTN